jgi:hypothetical protein
MVVTYRKVCEDICDRETKPNQFKFELGGVVRRGGQRGGHSERR